MRRLYVLAILLLAPALAGCASIQRWSDTDPLEGFNRKMFWINQKLDRNAALPAAVFYRSSVPDTFRDGLHNHIGQIVQTADELDRCMKMTDPKLFHFSPDTAHLHLAGCDVVKTLDRYQDRLMLADYKDAKRAPKNFKDQIFDLGDGEIDFPGCHRVLKSIAYKGWLCVDLDTAREGPRKSYERCGAYVVDKLEPIYV